MHSWTILVHGWAMGKHRFTSLTMAQTWGKPSPFPLIVYSMPGHETSTQMSFLKLKFPKLRFLQLWGPIILCVDLWLKWGLKQNCSPRWKFTNDMSHATWTQGNRGDSWLLMVRNQIGNLTPGPSFGHNLCFKCPNESCEPILDI
jgi:hypothetical protein